MNKKKIIVLVGASGSGKTTVANKLIESYGYKKVVTTTTRAPRPGEVNGIDYHFVSKEEFANKLNNHGFVEFTNYAGKMYGTGNDEIDAVITGKDPAVIVMDEVGATFMKSTYGEYVLIAHIRRERYDVIMSILERDIPNEEKAKRINNLDAEDMAASHLYLYDVSEINKDVETVAARLHSLLNN